VHESGIADAARRFDLHIAVAYFGGLRGTGTRRGRKACGERERREFSTRYRGLIVHERVDYF
jgi:hypothetical protein